MATIPLGVSLAMQKATVGDMNKVFVMKIKKLCELIFSPNINRCYVFRIIGERDIGNVSYFYAD